MRSRIAFIFFAWIFVSGCKSSQKTGSELEALHSTASSAGPRLNDVYQSHLDSELSYSAQDRCVKWQGSFVFIDESNFKFGVGPFSRTSLTTVDKGGTYAVGKNNVVTLKWPSGIQGVPGSDETLKFNENFLTFFRKENSPCYKFSAFEPKGWVVLRKPYKGSSGELTFLDAWEYKFVQKGDGVEVRGSYKQMTINPGVGDDNIFEISWPLVKQTYKLTDQGKTLDGKGNHKFTLK